MREMVAIVVGAAAVLAALMLGPAASAPAVRAQGLTPTPRPTVSELAAGVMACMEAEAGDPLVLTAGWDRAVILAASGPLLDVLRTEPGVRGLGVREHTIADDPISPPLVMSTERPAFAPHAIACFDREYRHLLRP